MLKTSPEESFNTSMLIVLLECVEFFTMFFMDTNELCIWFSRLSKPDQAHEVPHTCNT